MLRTNQESDNREILRRLHWRHTDLLMYCMGTDGDAYVTVTPGKPPRVVQRQHDFFRTHTQIKPLVDLGLLELVRTEVYPNGASCEIWTASDKARRIITGHLESLRAFSAARHAAEDERRQAEIKAAYRECLIAELDKQYSGDYFIPALDDAIRTSTTPFLDTPMPMFAPTVGGHPISIRDYLIHLWIQILPDDAVNLMKEFLMWSDVLGEDEAAQMLRDKLGIEDEPPTYGRINWTEDDETQDGGNEQ